MFIVTPSPNPSLSLPFPTGNKNNEPIEQNKPPRPHAQHPRGYQRNKRSNFLKLLALRWHVPPLPVRSCSCCCCCCYLVAVVVAAAVTQFDNKYYKLDNNKNKKNENKRNEKKRKKNERRKSKKLCAQNERKQIKFGLPFVAFSPPFSIFHLFFFAFAFLFLLFPKNF